MKVMKLSLIFTMVTILGIFGISSTSNAEAAYDMPDWIKNLAGMWFSGAIDDDAFGAALDWLIENEIITATLSSTSSSTSSSTNTGASTFNGNSTHMIFPIGGNGTHAISHVNLIGGNSTHMVFPIGGNGTHIIIPIN